MRLHEISDRFPKPTHVITYSDDEEIGRVFVRPSAGTISKCIYNYDCRGLIFDDGTLMVWPEQNMYHGDVLKQVPHTGNCQYLMLFTPATFLWD